jgi:circadian clock protein KaiC
MSAPDKAVTQPVVTQPVVSTGIEGLDLVLSGGLTANRLYLIEGMPGSGKTTLALQFLLEGVRRGQAVLYVALSETKEEAEIAAASHGWSFDGVFVRELIPTEESLAPGEQYTMFHPAEVELSEATKRILSDVEEVKPKRVVIDSLSEFQLLAGHPSRYRRQMLALKHFFAARGCTVLLLDDLTTGERSLQVQSIAHGVISLEQLAPEYGAHRRRLRVLKYRGVNFRGGFHDYSIVRGGLEVFPRLVAADHRQAGVEERLASGLPQLDQLLGGGLEKGTSTMVVGGPGTGKSTLAAQFAAAAAEGGESAAMFIFDESPAMLVSRCEALGIRLRRHLDAGRVTAQRVDPAELSPGEFAHAIRCSVERHGAAVVVIDSLNGYLNAMPEERFLVTQLHEILTYLGQKHVITILVGAHHGIIGGPMSAPVDASYLADAVILLRYYETKGEVRQAISVIKKRGGNHERTIRDFRLAGGRIQVGEPLRGFRGVLTGVPVPVDEEQSPAASRRRGLP